MTKIDSVIEGGRPKASFRLLLEGLCESAKQNGQLLSPDDLVNQATAS